MESSADHWSNEKKTTTICYLAWKGNENRTVQGINISHLGKRKIIFKMPFLGDMLVPRRVPCSYF